ncbi:M35 family metallo-endopeptidase [Caballeronia sp. GAFFF1]|uniref:M35 family metallo-endopeptidase n=1 Tax=Caballeronia sp. GAFFF1 TaxID=2921779 RepID=UPI0020293E76|nr:M35 family metallo-endopeptidase [Caballeronia sp. GAFFF1]
MANQDYFEVASATTNTVEKSSATVFIDSTPICPNMTDREFRELAAKLLKASQDLVERRLADLRRYDAKTKERMTYWFGTSDEPSRRYLIAGFEKVSRVLGDLRPTNLIRSLSDEDRSLGCAPNLKNLDGEAAHVCKPNINTRRIAIAIQFCTTLSNFKMFADSRVSTLIHEVTHFLDTFDSTDEMYSISTPLALWGQRNSVLALRNADSLAGFVVYDESIG